MRDELYLVSLDERKFLKNAGDRVPLGLLSMASNIDYPTKIVDLNHDSRKQLLEDIAMDHPKYVGISLFTSPVAKQGIELAKQIRTASPKSTLIAGGYHASIFPVEMLSRGFNYSVIGDGEISLQNIIEGSKIKIQNNQIKDISQLNIPDRFLIDMSRYDFKQNGKAATTMATSRGCPYNCSFCGNLNRYARFNSVDNVIKEVQQIKELGFNEIYFFDDIFTMKKDRTLELTNRLKQENIGYRITTRANLIDRDIAKALVNSGCHTASIGVESANNKSLKRMNKGMTFEDNEKAIKILDNHGISTKLFFMLGIPGETYNDALLSIRYAKDLKERHGSQSDFYILTPFPGSDIFKNPDKYGITIKDYNFDEYLQASCGQVTPKLNLKTITDKQLLKLYRMTKK